MRPPDELIIVQRHQYALYKTLRQATRGTAEVLFDRRQRERRRGGVYAGVERRQAERRRVLSVDERARWTELRHLIRTPASHARMAWSPMVGRVLGRP